MANPPRRVLLVASTTGYQTRMFLDAAEVLGYDVTLATDRCHVLEDPWGDRALPLRFDDPDGAAEAVGSLPRIDGIVALGDRPAYLAAVIAERLALRFHSVESVSACRNKHLTRSRFRAAGLLVPDFYRLPVDEDPPGSAPYPCVLKPLGLSASRGVIRADNAVEFATAFQRIRALLDSPDIRRLRDEQDRFIQVESFIPGTELALEGIVDNGTLHVIALFDKPDPLDGPFFEETIYVTPSRQDAHTQEAIRHTTQQAVQALGLTHGPIHAEMRVNDRGVWMLEVAARPIGGLCARVLPGLPELILRHAAGEFEPGTVLGVEAAGVMMIPIPREGIYQDAAGVDAAKAVPGIEDVIITAKQGQKLVPLPEGNSYLGFIFARGKHPDEVEAALRNSHAQLAFEINTALRVML
jgi:ATP-grasp domain/L-amino acid ligase C-terminal domain 2